MFTTIVVFLTLLSVLVFVHEFGHFRAARFFGIHVEEFGFGFPPRLYSIIRGATRYSLNWIPLGGFVKIKGENGEAMHEPDSFSAQKAWKRYIVLASGVAMNILLGVLLYTILFTIGIDGPASSGGSYATITNQRVVLREVLKNSPAAIAGLQPLDTFIRIDGNNVYDVPMFQAYIQEHQGKQVALGVKRGEQMLTVLLTPDYLPGEKKGGIGVYIEEEARIRYPWFLAPWKALEATGRVLFITLQAFGVLLLNLFTGRPLLFEVSGPVGIAVVTHQVLQVGFRSFLEFSAIISLNLALVNALPIPALDGGRIFFLFLEKVRGKSMNARIEHVTHLITFFLLITLMIVVTYFDVLRLIKVR